MKKKISEHLLNEIKTKSVLSLGIAEILDIRELSVLQLVERKSGKLNQYSVAEFLIEQGYSKDEIFEKQPTI